MYEICYKPYRPVGYGYENHTEFIELSGTGMKIRQKLQDCRVRV